MTRKIKRIEVGCRSNINGLRFYEIKVYFDNEDGQERITRKNIGFSTLKRMGIIKTFNSTKKLNEWLNTDDGRIFVAEKLNDSYNQYSA